MIHGMRVSTTYVMSIKDGWAPLYANVIAGAEQTELTWRKQRQH